MLKIRFLLAVQNCCFSVFLHLSNVGCKKARNTKLNTNVYVQSDAEFCP